jgi:hypothetical protein
VKLRGSEQECVCRKVNMFLGAASGEHGFERRKANEPVRTACPEHGFDRRKASESVGSAQSTRREHRKMRIDRGAAQR